MVNITFGTFFAGFAFGVFGFYFLKEGRRNRNPIGSIVGLTMMVYPYFVVKPFPLWAIGIGLTIIGFKTIPFK